MKDVDSTQEDAHFMTRREQSWDQLGHKIFEVEGPLNAQSVEICSAPVSSAVGRTGELPNITVQFGSDSVVDEIQCRAKLSPGAIQ
jgi:hypothetical protein